MNFLNVELDNRVAVLYLVCLFHEGIRILTIYNAVRRTAWQRSVVSRLPHKDFQNTIVSIHERHSSGQVDLTVTEIRNKGRSV